METLGVVALAAGIVLLVGLNVLVWEWVLCVCLDWRRERRDADLQAEVIRLTKLTRDQESALRSLNDKAAGIQAHLSGRC